MVEQQGETFESVNEIDVKKIQDLSNEKTGVKNTDEQINSLKMSACAKIVEKCPSGSFSDDKPALFDTDNHVEDKLKNAGEADVACLVDEVKRLAIDVQKDDKNEANVEDESSDTKEGDGYDLVDEIQRLAIDVQKQKDEKNEANAEHKSNDTKERDVNDLVDEIQGLAIDDEGQDESDRETSEEGGCPDPQEDEDTRTSESEEKISCFDVKSYIRVDGPHDLRNGHQIAKVGEQPSIPFDCCRSKKTNGKCTGQVVAHAPDGACATATSNSDVYRRKVKNNMTGGGIVGGNETKLPLAFSEHEIRKAMRPMHGAGDFTSSSVSGMTGGSMQAPGHNDQFPQIKDPLAISSSTHRTSLPSINAVLNKQPTVTFPSFGTSMLSRNPPEVYQFGRTSGQQISDEVKRIEDFLHRDEQLPVRVDILEKPVPSPYSGSSGIGSPGDSFGVSSPGSVYSDMGERVYNKSESDDDGFVGEFPNKAFDTLDLIVELIEDDIGPKVPLHVGPPTASSQASALISQLVKPPMNTHPSSQTYAPHTQITAQVPNTAAVVPTTTSVPTSLSGAVIVGVLINVPSAGPMKKGLVPILPRPAGSLSQNTALPTPTKSKRGSSRKSKGSKSKGSPSPQSGSPQTGPDSVFFAPSPDGSSSDTSFLSSSSPPGSVCHMSPMSSHGVPSPGSAGLPCMIPDSQLPMTIPTGFTPLPTNSQMYMPQGLIMNQTQPNPVGLSRNVTTAMPMSMPATLPQNVMMPSNTALSMAPAAPIELGRKPEVEFQKPVDFPPHTKKTNRPSLKIDTKSNNVTSGGALTGAGNQSMQSQSQIPVPASPSTPTTMSHKSRAFGIINSLPWEKFQAINEDGDCLIHQFIVHGDVQLIDAFLARCKRQDCLAKFINLKNYDGQTPLYLAVLVNEVAIVKILLEYGADATIMNNSHSSVLHCAAKKCQFGYAILELLLTMPETKLDLSVRTYEGMTPLHLAIQAHGYPVDDQPQIGNSLETVELLFKHGANAHDKACKDEKSALHFAIERKSPEIMEKVLKYGDANKLVKDATGSSHTGLHIAAGLPMKDISVKIRMIKLLVTNGADLDSRNREGRAPKDLVPNPKGTGKQIVELLKIQRNPGRCSNPTSPQQFSENSNQQNLDSSQTLPSQNIAVTQAVMTNGNMPCMNTWPNPPMAGYVNQGIAGNQEPFLDQQPLYGQGLCENSDSSLEAIVTSLPSVSLADIGLGTDPAYSQDALNSLLYSQVGGVPRTSACMEQPYSFSHVNQPYTQPGPVYTSTNQQCTMANTPLNTQGYSQTVSQLNSHQYPQTTTYNQTYTGTQNLPNSMNQTYLQNTTSPMNHSLTSSDQYTASQSLVMSSLAQQYVGQTYNQQGLSSNGNQIPCQQQQKQWTTGSF